MKKVNPAIVVFAFILMSSTVGCLLLSSTVGWSLPPCPYSPTTHYWVYKNWTHCEGTIAYPDGDKYIGGWRGGYFHGQGTYTYADGSKYVGEYKNGARHGRGKETLTGGKKPIGEFKDGFYYGSYVGELKDGSYHRQATTYDTDYSRDYVGYPILVTSNAEAGELDGKGLECEYIHFMDESLKKRIRPVFYEVFKKGNVWRWGVSETTLSIYTFPIAKYRTTIKSIRWEGLIGPERIDRITLRHSVKMTLFGSTNPYKDHATCKIRTHKEIRKALNKELDAYIEKIKNEIDDKPEILGIL